jgi:hypothetical protein
VTNVSESFSALATRLNVNPTKLCEYNFLYDCSAGVTPGNSIRVPFDQCTPKPGVWKRYEVKGGDTLVSVANSPESLVLDPIMLKNTNLDILYDNPTLHTGMHLRLPLHICFEDELSDCYIVTADDHSLDDIAIKYGTTGQHVCQSNPEVFGRAYCDPSNQPLPNPHIGMELSVPNPHPVPPSPCQEIPGYWSCYSVKAGDSMFGIAIKVNITVGHLITLNFGKNPKHCRPHGDPATTPAPCGNTTFCPPGPKS